MPKSFVGKDVVHSTDELVYVLRGQVSIQVGNSVSYADEGGMYFVPAGTPTTMVALVDSRLLCIFSPTEMPSIAF